jgi:hypothetical protein
MSGTYARPLPDNELLRRTTRPPASLGQVFGASLGIETSVSVLARDERIRAAEGQPPRPAPLISARPLFFDPAIGITSAIFGEDVPERIEAEIERVPAEILNEEFGDLGLKFDRPVTRKTAELLAEAKRAEIIRNDIIARGPGGVLGFAVALAGGLIATAIDPLELATAFVPIVGEARLAGLVSRVGRVGGRTTAGVIEGAVGNALIEPLFFTLSRQQQLDYGMADALMNVGLGGLLGGLGGVGRGVFDARSVRRATEPPFKGGPSGARAESELPDIVRQMSAERRVEAFRASIAQAAQGKRVDVSPFVRERQAPDGVAGHAPGGANRPQTLIEFISQNGGIDDIAATFRGEIAARGNPNTPFAGRLSREGSTRDLDDFADLAQQEGFIRNRDPRELLDAIDEELAGNPRVRESDIAAQQEIAAGRTAQFEADRLLGEFDQANAELRALGITDATPDEISRVAEIMRRDQVGAEDAFERLAIESADEVAIRESDPSRDFSADFDASARIDRELDEGFDIEGDNDDLLAMIDQMRQSDTLPGDAEAQIAEANALASHAQTYGKTARVAAACLAG